jgi:hypothetical protein
LTAAGRPLGRHRLRFPLGLLLAAAVSCGFAGCFSPRQPTCAFSCAGDGRCPTGYSCAGDGLCHREDGVGTCDLPPQDDAAMEVNDGQAARDGADGDGADAGD